MGRADDDEETAIFDSARRSKKDTARGHDASARPSSARTKRRTESPAERQLREDRERDEFRKRSIELATPTQITPDVPVATPARADPAYQEKSEPIRVISMKTPHAEPAKRAANPHVVKLRAISEFHSSTPPGGMGRFAPPRDAKQVRGRRIRDVVLWGLAVVAIGSLVMLGVFLLARR